MPMTCPGREVAAASDVIGIDDVFEARIASRGKTASARRKISCFTFASSTTASMSRSAATKSPTIATRPRASAGSTPPFSASFARLFSIVARARSAAPGASSWSETRRPEAATTCAIPPPICPAPTTRTCSKITWRSLRSRRAGQIRAGALAQAPERPQEDEREDHDPDDDLDRSTTRLAPLDDESAGLDDAARRGEPGVVGRLREEKSDRLVLRHVEITVGARRRADLQRLRNGTLHALVDLEGEKEYGRPPNLRPSLGDDSPDDCRVGLVEPLGERGVRTHARCRRARERERAQPDEEERPQTSIRSASPCPPPEQIAASPSPPPVRRRSCTIVPTMRPPEAPIGCPSATAPPFTFTIDSSTPSMRVEFF